MGGSTLPDDIGSMVSRGVRKNLYRQEEGGHLTWLAETLVLRSLVSNRILPSISYLGESVMENAYCCHL